MERANKPPASTKPRSSPTDGSLCARASPAIAARLEEKTGSGAGAAVVWSTRARTQQPTVPTIGWLSLSTEPTVRTALEAFRSGLADFGYTEGKNIRVLYRYADGNADRLSALTVELVSLGAVTIVTHGGASIQAAHNAAPN